MTPTVEDYAIAIVAACRETGEDPLKIEQSHINLHCRHYAVHALLHVFQGLSPRAVCKTLGVERPNSFWPSSLAIAQKKHPCKWWSDEGYDRVIRAIEADRTRRNVTPQAPQEHVGEVTTAPLSSITQPRITRPRPRPAQALVHMADDKPVFDKGHIHEPKRQEYLRPTSKADLYEELRKAVINTKPKADE